MPACLSARMRCRYGRIFTGAYLSIQEAGACAGCGCGVGCCCGCGVAVLSHTLGRSSTAVLTLHRSGASDT